MSSDNLKPARSRLKSIFTYIRELTKLRTPPVSNSESYEWSLRISNLPSYPTIQSYTVPSTEDNDFDGVLLRVKRPKETLCPKPSKQIESWLKTGWDRIEVKPEAIQAKNSILNGQTTTESFLDDQARVKAFEDWLIQREKWEDAERPVREALRVFSDFFSLHGLVQRESEKFQLYIGDGHLVWDSAVTPVDHPILLRKVELEFDSSVPEFIIKDCDEDTEVYTSLLRHHELDGRGIVELKQKLGNENFHPMSNGKCDDYLKFFIQRFFENGKFKDKQAEINKSEPSVYRDAVIFLGSRTQGFTEALDKLIESTDDSIELSEALLRMVGIDEKVPPQNSGIGNSSTDSLPPLPSEIDFLLTKPSNKEQERVIERLENTGSVLVQGPPGTGKSHTIANIIGHLLASGRTVLVSSHTSKALKVVREKVAANLQPLCVAVLENDTEGKSQLEESVNGIVSYLSRADSASISREISQLEERRRVLKDQLRKAEADALEIRKGEYEDILVGGEAIPPSEAARRISGMDEKDFWIPGPLKRGASLSVVLEDLQFLYDTNSDLSIEDELCIEEGLPAPTSIIDPSRLNELFESISAIKSSEAKSYEQSWKHDKQDFQKLDEVILALNKAMDVFKTHSWVQKVIEETSLSDEHIRPWESLISQVNIAIESTAKKSELILKHGPKINGEINESLLLICKNLLNHIKLGKKVTGFTTLFNSDWKNLLKSARVDSGEPKTEEHFDALIAYVETELIRKDLESRWERQVVMIGGPKLDAGKPEAKAKSLLYVLSLAARWNTQTWKEIQDDLQGQGFLLKELIDQISNETVSHSPLQKMERIAVECLIPAINARKLWVRLRLLESQRLETIKSLKENFHKAANVNAYLRQMLEAVELKDINQYRNAFNYFMQLHLKIEINGKRSRILKVLDPIAPSWAGSIKLRKGPHGRGQMPNDPFGTWKLTQWKEEIDRRMAADYSKVQRDVLRIKVELQEVNAQYVEKLAWRYQLGRTGLVERQALTGWQQLQNRITKTGRGKRDAILRKESQRTLKNCKNAVPVWIMPLSRIFESFDLTTTKFDVLILDEASQSDITALVAFSIAKQVIVVGDKEQVTPSAVGEELGKIQVLIDEILKDIPNKLLYTGKTSIYDLAEQSFGETIRLVEHFRCVPDIIQFSNNLCYGDIRPLRESSSSPFKKQLIAHRIQGATSDSKKNKKEALEVASIICAMTETQEYSSSSIGVISMVGTDQALLVDTILQRKLPVDKYAKHSLMCGNASQFQGDERDIILISMVDSCDNPPLSIRQEDKYQKTFNVASSRARNQMWVVHSLNPATDLKPMDLRLRLINHAENPRAIDELIKSTQAKADPKSEVFEPRVIKDLMIEGFRVTPQWKVGAYTIDLVVQGKSKRVAIECDGDRFHPPEKLSEDIYRQMVLERLGWRFIRIRGTEYFRNPQKTMKRVAEELENLGVEKLGHEIPDTEDDLSDDLQNKILARAAELREKWDTEGDVVDDKSRKSGWGKKSTAKKIIMSMDPEVFDSIVKEEPEPNAKTRSSKATSMLNSKNIVLYLTDKGFEVIDKRQAGGSLWVIDSPEFQSAREQIEELSGVKFALASNGSASTKNRPGWYTKK